MVRLVNKFISRTISLLSCDAIVYKERKVAFFLDIESCGTGVGSQAGVAPGSIRVTSCLDLSGSRVDVTRMINTFSILAAATLLLGQTSLALRLPHYLKSCKVDASFEACALKNGQDSIATLVKGDPQYRIPKLEPLGLDEIKIDQGSGPVQLSLTGKDVKVHGLSHAVLKSIKFDSDSKLLDIGFTIDKVIVLAKYDISGKVLVLPITGTGDLNITLDELSGVYKVKLDLKKNEKDGKDYAQINNSDFKFSTKRAHFQLDNLFNGDKALGDNMNVFLNENWAEVFKEFGPAVGDVINVVISRILTGVFELVPYEDIFEFNKA
uniref:Protein takeout n=1 Tax=Timema monikensis TaxID=170555 RepID=A0A7R9EC65_9NEOP|nr:unnamed protein product [Timema monikensis]